MPSRTWLACPLLLVSLLDPLHSQQSASWQDPSPHSVQFVAVDQKVRLEVLDWGGTGRPVALLAGGREHGAHIRRVRAEAHSQLRCLRDYAARVRRVRFFSRG